MIKAEILENLRIGQRIAESEQINLSDYFVSTRFWNELIGDEVDIVFGDKGTGKSALYMMLYEKRQELAQDDIFLVRGEQPGGIPVSRSLGFFTTGQAVGVPSFENYRTRQLVEIWKLYFVILILKDQADLFNDEPEMSTITRILKDEGLIRPNQRGLLQIIESTIDYIRKIFSFESLEVETPSVFGFTGTVKFQNQSELGIASTTYTLDEIFGTINEILAKKNRKLWIILDRLDVAFAEDLSTERKVIAALFKTYLDGISYNNLRMKVFIRTDIWRRISLVGFSEASHITRFTTIRWSKDDLIDLIMRRLFQNTRITNYYSISAGEKTKIDVQESCFNQVFPQFGTETDNDPKAIIDWMLEELGDGKERVTPRDLIHFLEQLKRLQLQEFIRGRDETIEKELFSEKCINNALNEVAKTKFDQSILPEFPELRNFILVFQGGLVRCNTEILKNLWGLENDSEVLAIANQLVEIGFFKKRYNPDGNLEFEVPKFFQRSLRN